MQAPQTVEGGRRLWRGMPDGTQAVEAKPSKPIKRLNTACNLALDSLTPSNALNSASREASKDAAVVIGNKHGKDFAAVL